MFVYCFTGDVDTCSLGHGPITEIPKTYDAWLYPKNSILRQMFDRLWKILDENGNTKKMEAVYFPLQETCPPDEFAGVNFYFVLALFIMLAFGILASNLLLFIEFAKCSSIRSI